MLAVAQLDSEPARYLVLAAVSHGDPEPVPGLGAPEGVCSAFVFVAIDRRTDWLFLDQLIV